MTAPRELETARLTLRAWAPGDAEALRAALDVSDAHLRPWIPFMKNEPRSLEETRAQIVQFVSDFDAGLLRYGLWCGVLLVGEALLFTRPSEPVGDGLEVGYWIHRDHVGQGYATEATRALVALAFDGLGVDRVRFLCDVGNAASSNVALKLGASPLGVEEGSTLQVWELRRS